VAGIGVIFNPRSGHNLRNPRAARKLARTLGDNGVIREAGSLDELYRVAEDFRKLDIDVLCISGGDGTNGTTITGFLDVYQGNALPSIAFLRGGTMNTVANACGVRRGKPEGLLDRLCRAYVARAAQPLADTERYVMCIEGRPSRTKTDTDAPPASVLAPSPLAKKYGFNFGTGAVRGYLAEYYAYGKGEPPNPLIAAKTLLRGIGSAAVGGEMIKRLAAPFRGSVELPDGTSWEERDYFALAAGTIDQIGLNFRPFYRFGEKPNTFHLLGIHTSTLGFISQLPRIWRAQPMKAGHTLEAVTGKAVIRAPGPIKYMIDGDLFECSGELHISCGPKVRIILT
jgi:diacylglycerol kinase family enzyme